MVGTERYLWSQRDLVQILTLPHMGSVLGSGAFLTLNLLIYKVGIMVIPTSL